MWLTKKTELKLADSQHHLVVIPGTFDQGGKSNSSGKSCTCE